MDNNKLKDKDYSEDRVFNKKTLTKKNKSTVIDAFIANFADKAKAAETFKQNYVPLMTELESFHAGSQWAMTAANTNETPSWENKSSSNLCHVIANRKTADLTYDEVTIKLLPTQSKDGDKVETLEQVLNNLWKTEKMHYFVNEAVKDSRVQPIGITKIQHIDDKIVGSEGNLSKGDFAISSVPPQQFFWDPSAFELKDCKYVYETSRTTFAELEREKAFDQNVIKNIKDSLASDQGTDMVGEFLVNRDYTTGQEQVLFLKEVYFKYKLNASKYAVAKLIMIGDNTVIFRKDDIGLSMYPYSILREYKKSQEFLGKSSVSLVLSNQKFIDRVDSIVANIATQNQNPQKLVSIESGLSPEIVAKYGDKAGAVYAVNGSVDNAIRYMDTPEVSSSLMAAREAKKQEMFEVAGISQASLGNAPGSVATTGGINSLLQQSDFKEADPKIQFRAYIVRLVEIMMSYLGKHKTSVEFRLDSTNPQSEWQYQFVKIVPADIVNMAPEIIIEIPMSQAEKKRKRDVAMQILSVQAQTGQKIFSVEDFLHLIDLPDTERLISNSIAAKEAKAAEEMVQASMLAAQFILQAISNDQLPPGASGEQLIQMAAQQAIQTVKEQEQGGNGAKVPQEGGV